MSISIFKIASLLNHNQSNINIKQLSNKYQNIYTANINTRQQFTLNDDFQIQFYYQGIKVTSTLTYIKDMVIYYKLTNNNSKIGETFKDLFSFQGTITDTKDLFFTMEEVISGNSITYTKNGLISGTISISQMNPDTTLTVPLTLNYSDLLIQVADLKTNTITNSFQVSYVPGGEA